MIATERAQASERSTPRPLYESRLADRTREASELEIRAERIANARVAVFVAGLVVAAMAWGFDWIHPLWLLIPAIVFTGLLIVSDTVRRALEPAQRRVDFYASGLARLEDRWMGHGEDGHRFALEDHPYDLDLDLFGKGSLYERICTARTVAGQETLARWFLEPADLDEVRARQIAVDELRNHVDLREDLAVLGDRVREGVSPATLIAWGEAPARPAATALRLGLAVLSVLNFAGLTAWAVTNQFRWFFVMVLISGAASYALKRRVAAILEGIDRKADELSVLARLLERIERETFQAPWLVDLRRLMDVEGTTASREIGHLAFRAQLLEAQRNQLFMPIALMLFWSTQLAFSIEKWRARMGHRIAPWLEAVGRFEALCAFSGYAFENPDDPFPELVSEGPCFDAEGLGHPLLPVARCVRNSLALGGPSAPHVLMVSGSNMSGKSTLLRSVGVNAVLALAGAPVRAHRLQISPLCIGATLRVQDSLQAGRSRFYAEITRLRQLVDLARGPVPLLFLLDEILHGTNSHDRRAGAEAVIRGLASMGAIGLVTTHDLALAAAVDELGVSASNVHFEDHLENGEMTFDYIMRPGVVAKSNALALMRAVGLDV